MQRIFPAAMAIASCLMLGACDGGGDEAADPQAVSEGELRALEEAADMLDETRLPEGALPETGPSPAQPDQSEQEIAR